MCFFGAVLLSLDAVPLDLSADGAFVAVKLFGDFGDGAVARGTRIRSRTKDNRS